jgi:hypothetical protein
LYDGLNFIIPFVRKLRRKDPARRPDAAAALELFKALISKMTDKELDRTIRRTWRFWEVSWQNLVLFLRGVTS